MRKVSELYTDKLYALREQFLPISYVVPEAGRVDVEGGVGGVNETHRGAHRVVWREEGRRQQRGAAPGLLRVQLRCVRATVREVVSIRVKGLKRQGVTRSEQKSLTRLDALETP